MKLIRGGGRQSQRRDKKKDRKSEAEEDTQGKDYKITKLKW